MNHQTVSGEAAHRRWMAVAALCAAAAAVLLFTAGVEAAFVAAVSGALAWFWDQRNSIRAKVIERENSEEGRDGIEEFEDEGGADDERGVGDDGDVRDAGDRFDEGAGGRRGREI